MNKRSTIQFIRTEPVVRASLSIVLMLLLVLLTSINFFIYSGDGRQMVAFSCVETNEECTQGNPNPAGPDEKTPGNAVSITEEYIHESEGAEDPFWTNAFFSHKIHEAEKLNIVHYDIFSPPPEA